MVNPPVIVSEIGFHQQQEAKSGHYRVCLDMIHKGLLEMQYEYRITELATGDFGCQGSDTHVILIASKIGLPYQLGYFTSYFLLTVESNTERALQCALRERGFKDGYKLCGDQETQLRRIREAIPPPMAKAIAHSIFEHFDNVIERVNFLRAEEAGESRKKRKALEGLQSERNKKVR